MISRRLLVGIALTIPCNGFAATREAWATYRNTRFGTSIEYPERFRPARPPDNNDGQTFDSGDGAILRVWGSLNISNDDRATLERQMREDGQGSKEIYSYAAHGENWFVFSGRRGPDDLFYKRYLLSHRGAVINAFDIGYADALKTEYDPIVTRMSRSLKAGSGYQVKGAP